jgi:hypothetical protein
VARVPDRREILTRFAVPPLPAGLAPWVDLVRGLAGDELSWRGEPLDGQGVVDAESAALALEGYRFVFEQDEWRDAAESGAWRPEWLILDTVFADPIIAGVSRPGIPVLADAHGRGRWDPVPVADSLVAFIASLERIGAGRSSD